MARLRNLLATASENLGSNATVLDAAEALPELRLTCQAKGAVSLFGMRYAKAAITYLLTLTSRSSSAAADPLAANSSSPSVGFEHGMLSLTLHEASAYDWCVLHDAPNSNRPLRTLPWPLSLSLLACLLALR